jgi:hypothetical protein
MPISSRLSLENSRRLRKLEAALSDLQDGRTGYFSITKLTSIKSLCRDEACRKEYCAYLASLVTEKTQTTAKDENPEDVRNLVQEAGRAIFDLANETGNNEMIAQKALSRLRKFQDEYRKINWATVRIITNNDLLILENILQSLLSQKDTAASCAYDATRNYVERYNPHCGTGLIAESIPMLNEVVQFWKRHDSP